MIHEFLSFGPSQRSLKFVPTQKMCSWMFLAALHVIIKTRKQPRCPSIGERINKLWYTETKVYYPTLKRNELSSHEKTRRELKFILLSKISHLTRLTTVWFLLHIILKKAKMWRHKRNSDCQGWRGKELNRQSTEDFQDSKNTKCDIIMVDII